MDGWIPILGLLATLIFAFEAAALLRAASKRSSLRAAEAHSGRPLRVRVERRRQLRRRSDGPL